MMRQASLMAAGAQRSSDARASLHRNSIAKRTSDAAVTSTLPGHASSTSRPPSQMALAAPARWLIVSDNRSAAEEYRRLIEGRSTSGQRAWVPPEGYALWSLLELRHTHGIVQSSLRAWSSFSALPAVAAGVPIFGLAGSLSRWGGVLPHTSCETVEQFMPNQESAFIERLISGVRNCSKGRALATNPRICKYAR